jgi:dihydrodipicolinate synthase/N-acetylneuraminate lyase
MCRDQKLFEARRAQEELAALRQALKPSGVAGIKAAMRAMGRDCGEPRPPLLPLDAAAYQKLVGELDAIRAMREEPKGW